MFNSVFFLRPAPNFRVDCIDREGEGNIPNIANLRVINEYIREGFWVDPFRILYPERKESSFISFRRDINIVKNRLDFFLVSPGMVPAVSNVAYENRLGLDFDHKEVTLRIGRQK
jgi:exonuclease III